MKSNSKNRSSMEPKAGSMKRTIQLINLKPEQSKLKDKNANYHTFLSDHWRGGNTFPSHFMSPVDPDT